MIDRNTGRPRRLVDDILTISRADSDRLKLTLEAVDVEQLVHRAAESAGPVAKGKGVDLVTEVNGTPIEVEGDRRLLAQLLDNLVSNAVKFTPEGGSVTIRACGDGGTTVVEVTDTGAGIPPDDVPKVFDRFFRAPTAADVPGTGLGLAISKAIVEAHGGSIGVESELGVGSGLPVRAAALTSHACRGAGPR